MNTQSGLWQKRDWDGILTFVIYIFSGYFEFRPWEKVATACGYGTELI